MKKLLLCAVLLLLPGLCRAQVPSPLCIAATDACLYREGANHISMQNGNSAQAFNLYNYISGSNYERAGLSWSGNMFRLTVQNAGTGSARVLVLEAQGRQFIFDSSTFFTSASDTVSLGANSVPFANFYLSRSVQGSKSKALTEGAETAVTQIAVPQTAGANFADATIDWTVYATDGTDTQTRRGSSYLAAVNAGGTETCTVGDIGTTVVAVSGGTLTCTTSCITGLTDVVRFGLNCTSSLTQTTLNALVRLNLMQSNTVTPQ